MTSWDSMSAGLFVVLYIIAWFLVDRGCEIVAGVISVTGIVALIVAAAWRRWGHK